MESIEDLISDLKSIANSESYSHMQQAVLDLINELEEMKDDWDLIQINEYEVSEVFPDTKRL